MIVTHDRRVAQVTQRILRMHDGHIVADHRLLDPLEEDLRTLAYSRLGQALLGHAGNGDTRPAVLTPEEREVLRRVLAKVDGGEA